MTKEQAIHGRSLFEWKVPEREHYQHSQRWFIVFGTIILAVVVFSVVTNNFLLALIALLVAFIIVFNESETPSQVRFIVGTEGIVLGSKFYDYDEFKSFSVIYKPAQEIKSIYFDFNSSLRQDLVIPLLDNNPLPIRENLLKYLKEDLERVDESLTESLGRIIKL